MITTLIGRAGYQRQEAEPVHITCECGAVVLENKFTKELVHVGNCTVAERCKK